MKNAQNYIPYLVLALLVALGAYLLFTDRTEAPTPSEEVTTEEAVEQQSTEETPTPPVVSGGISLPEGVKIISQTAWATFTDPRWSLSFKYQQGWKASKIEEGSTLTGMSVVASAFTILMQEDKPIGEPALLTPKKSTQTIAGQSVEVREYVKPNETYAYYLYFTLTDGNDDYNVSIRSKSEDRKEVDAFIERLSMQ